MLRLKALALEEYGGKGKYCNRTQKAALDAETGLITLSHEYTLQASHCLIPVDVSAFLQSSILSRCGFQICHQESNGSVLKAFKDTFKGKKVLKLW